MQDSENPRKRSRIRTRVQSPSSEHAFSLDKEKEGESAVRVAISDNKKNPSSQSREHSHFEQFVKEHDSDLSKEKSLYDIPHGGTMQTNTPSTDHLEESMPTFGDAKTNNHQDTSSWQREHIVSRPRALRNTHSHQRSVHHSRFSDNPAVTPRFSNTGKTPARRRQNNDYEANKVKGMHALNARDFQPPHSSSNSIAQEGKYNASPRYNASKNRNRNFSKGKDRRKTPAKPFEIQPAANFIPSYPDEKANSSEPIRLNKFLANSGICSRRNADILIAEGKIKVNGEVVTTLGVEVTRQDVVEYKGKRVEIEPRIYVLLNKPKNCMTTSDDPNGRMTVLDLVKNACQERIYPVGRLDRNTTGVLLLTNDGDMMAKLLHPSFFKKKIYQVTLDRPVEVEHMRQIAQGIELSDGEIHADAISYVDENDYSVVGIELHSGRNRIVRRIFEHFGYKIYKLDRVYFAGLTKRNLPRGRWRYLTEEEVRRLRMGNYE